ncbi:oxygen-independent coproporphyrinogen III oxidase [Sphingomonas sp.]|uniref:oxygen-independent coproporphyrinogen III oxidase n=1 Tax=Sphingomonas sp. TaxID=28214 RepID=UPI000DB0DD2B|nr:oxygen-independent coproporphyrinogen III oxidase [Sphingomonas sp.]PZU11034.1 MAG: oxygen-independent coproporphyrinogen III oxidase [Sphingomonas sp.]
MHFYLPDLAARPVPRYTSYPTAAEFHDGVDAADQAAALGAIAPDAPVSLYVHIPYCHRICWYCGCNTGAIGRAERLDAYVDALEREVEAVAGRMRGRVVSIHFGGGSPNALTPAQFGRLIAMLRARFAGAADAEIAVELDPRALDPAFIAAMGQAGVARASLGVQTFAEPVQRRINRIQPYEMVAAAVAGLRAAGIAHVNLDLMIGLPGQSEEDVAESIRLALALAPDRVAMFGYGHNPGLLPRQRMIDPRDLPDAEARFRQSALAHDLLVAAGYRAIGFDHFARPEDSLAVAAAEGRLRRNFQGFTDEPGEAVIGIGASAISQFPGLLVQNEKHVARWRSRVAETGLAGVRGIARSADARLRGAIMERLLCDGRVDMAAVARARGLAPERLIGIRPRLAALEARGVIAIEGWRVTLAPWGWPYARLVAAALDMHRTIEIAESPGLAMAG